MLKSNWPIDRHAGKIYTRAMFEQFGICLYESGHYLVDEVEPDAVYIAALNGFFKGKMVQSTF